MRIDNINISPEKIEICAARNCNNKASHYLKLVYLNKWRWFCKGCKQSLSTEGLFAKIDDTSMTVTGHRSNYYE